MSKNIERNLTLVNIDRFFAGFWLITPVLVLYYQANGLNATQVFLIQAIFSFAVVVLEVPTGYFSDVVGRKTALVISTTLTPLGLAVYALSHDMAGFIAAEILIALALSLRSGTDSAILYDTLAELKREGEYARREGHGHMLWSCGAALAALTGGALATEGLRLPFIVNIVTASVLLPVAFFFREPRREIKPSHASLRDMGRAMAYCARHPEMRALMLFDAALMATGITGVWAYYLYYDQAGIPHVWYGALAAAFSLTGALAGNLAHRIEKRLGRRATLWLLMVIGPSFVALGLGMTWQALPFVFVNAFLWNLSVPLFRAYVNALAPSELRATVLSVFSLAGRLLYSAVAIVAGRIADTWSMGHGFAFLGVTFLAVGGTSLVLFQTNRRAQRHALKEK